MAPILPVSLAATAIQAPAALSGTSSAGAAFQSVFQDAIAKVESFNKTADTSVNNFLAGEGEDLHDVAIKTQQAELSFDMFLQVRNKIVSAYQEVMRMQV
jgi:flagellar hook-basal body complex protein FliE